MCVSFQNRDKIVCTLSKSNVDWASINYFIHKIASSHNILKIWYINKNSKCLKIKYYFKNSNMYVNK